MTPPDFETNETGTYERFTKQTLVIFRLRETLRDTLSVVDQLMPGIGHVVADIGFINDTLIHARGLLSELEDEEHERTKSEIRETTEPAVQGTGDEPGQPDQPDEGEDRSGPSDGSLPIG